MMNASCLPLSTRCLRASSLSLTPAKSSLSVNRYAARSAFPTPRGPKRTRHGDTQVSRLVRENLTRRALRFNIVLDDVSITHVAFSPEFTHAVEAKQVRGPVSLRAVQRQFSLRLSRWHNKLRSAPPSSLIRRFKRSRCVPISSHARQSIGAHIRFIVYYRSGAG